MKNRHLLLAATFLVSGCLKERFTPDKTDPRLPAYTEKGNQVGGALLNNLAWRTTYKNLGTNGTRQAFFLENYEAGDSLVIRLRGETLEGTPQGPVEFAFVLRGVPVRRWSDVGKLDGRTFALDGARNYALLRDDGRLFDPKTHTYFGRTGELRLQRVREVTNLTINDGPVSYHPFILSGTFRFKLETSGKTSVVENGRFDFNLRELGLYP